MSFIIQNYRSEYEIESHVGLQDCKAVIDEFYFTALVPSIYDIVVKRFCAELDDSINILDGFLINLTHMIPEVTASQRKEIVKVIKKFEIHANNVYMSRKKEIYDTVQSVRVGHR